VVPDAGEVGQRAEHGDGRKLVAGGPRGEAATEFISGRCGWDLIGERGE
jgi:hypothetical protein